MVYDGTEKTVSAQAGDLIGEDTCNVTVEGGKAINAGEYTAVAVSVDNTDYTLPEEADHAYVIEQRTVELLWTGHENLVYDGQPKAVAASVKNAVVIDEVKDDVQVTVEGGNEINACTEEKPSYTATASGLTGEDTANYKLPEEKTLSYVIAPKTVRIAFAGTEERTYDGEKSHVTAEVVAEDLVGEDTALATVAGGEEKNAGTYTATVASLDNTNYIAGEDQKAEYTILPLTAELVWSADSVDYNGAKAVMTATVGNVVEGDEVEVTVTLPDSVHAGNYTATADSLSNANYKLPENKTHDFVISPLTAVLEWHNGGDLIYDGEAKQVTASVGNAVEGDEVDVEVTGGNASEVGAHTATAVSLSNADYALAEEGNETVYYIHKLKAHEKVAPTCEGEGTEAYWECEECGKLFADDHAGQAIEEPVIIPAAGHVWGETSYEWDHEKATFHAHRVCTVDEEHVDEETVKATSKVTLAPTQEEKGQAVFTGVFENPDFTRQEETVEIDALKDMKVLYLPEGLRVISEEAFYGTGVQAVILPEGCETIEAKAFAESMNLRYILIPASVKTIAEDAFENCGLVAIDIQTAEEDEQTSEADKSEELTTDIMESSFTDFVVDPAEEEDEERSEEVAEGILDAEEAPDAEAVSEFVNEDEGNGEEK